MASAKELRLLTYFAEVARAGSIRGAARALSLSPPVVSEALSDLEAQLGVTLLKRTTRSMELTEVGGQVLRHAEAISVSADRALDAASEAGDRPSGQVGLTLPVELATTWLPSRLRAFEQRYPEIHVDVDADDRVVSLARSPYDLAVRSSYVRTPADRRNVIAWLPIDLVCAPSLLDGAEESVSDTLGRIGFIGYATGEAGRRPVKRLEAVPVEAPDKVQHITVRSRFTVNSQLVAHRYALEGFGAAILLGIGVREDIAAGRLARVSQSHRFGYVSVRIIDRDRYPTPAASALRKFLTDKAVDPAP